MARVLAQDVSHSDFQSVSDAPKQKPIFQPFCAQAVCVPVSTPLFRTALVTSILSGDAAATQQAPKVGKGHIPFERQICWVQVGRRKPWRWQR
jgi:hypothetical protein